MLANVDPEQAALDSYSAELSGQSPTVGWNDLLEHRRVVILGEAGSGKTRELQFKAESLRRSGKSAFFIRLDRLVSEPLLEVLGDEDSRRLRRWLGGRHSAIFFLDSVDESKLGRQKDFLTALDRFRDGLGSGLARATIIITSRITGWRPRTDAFELRARLPVPPPSAEDAENLAELHIVQLEALDEGRVKRFAEGLGIDPPDDFIRALDTAHAWEFARRPIDVSALSDYWVRHGCLGTLRELVEFDLEQKLAETQERAPEDPLSYEQARQGAMALGAAVAFCRRFEFQVPDDQPTAGDAAMDAAMCLPDDWRPELTSALLDRAIFDLASVGRIRFHHRRVAEYLAAGWLDERVARGCTLERLEELLFERSGDDRILRPSLAPVTAWLACGDEERNRCVRQWILEAVPALFLRHGDPASLPLDYREALLRRLVDRYRDRRRVWLQDEPESLARIADPDLAPVVRELATDRGLSDDLREVLVQVVRHGRLSDCVDDALTIIADPSESDELKHYAAAAVRDAGEQEHKQRLASIVAGWQRISSSLCGIVCEAIYPGGAGVHGMMTLLGKVEDGQGSRADLRWALTNHLDAVLPVDDQVPVIEGLIDLVRRPPHIQSGGVETPISARFSWAGDVALSVIASVLGRERLDAATTEITAEALSLLWPHRHTADFRLAWESSIPDALEQQPGVRRSFVWARLAELQSADEGGMHHAWGIFGFDGPINPEADDLDWLCADIQNRQSSEGRRLALSLAVDVWSQVGRPWRWRRRILRAARRDPSLKDKLRDRMENPLVFYLRRLWHRHIGQSVGDRWWWKLRRRKVSDFVTRLRVQGRLLLKLRGLAAGDAVGWLAGLVLEAPKEEGASRWAVHSWVGVRQGRGRLVAQAARTGCKRAWRRHQPPLPHERQEGDVTYHVVAVGLSGIAAGLEDGDLDLRTMSTEDVHLAIRYAVNEMNGFPDWFNEAAQQRPSEVGTIIAECIRGEWEIPEAHERVHGVVSAIRWHGKAVLPLAADAITAALEERDPERPEVLEDALAVLLQPPEPPLAALARVAAERTPTYSSDDRHHSIWIVIWFQTNCLSAMDYLEELLQHVEQPDQLVIAMCGALSGQHTLAPLIVDQPDYLSPACLRRLIPIVYRHVRPDEDRRYQSGVVHTPTTRDDAQFFRGRLLEQLAASDRPETEGVFEELMATPELEAVREWMAHLVEERRGRLADPPPWEPKDVRAFERAFESDPRFDRDLFEIGRRRLSDIKYSVEAAELSARSDLREGDPESALRTWLARQLRERARGRYTVSQEEEIDPVRYPDLRLTRPGMPPVPVEVKWADHCTGPELFERLENQLIGDYLHSHDAHYGFFVVGHKGVKQRWEHPKDRRRTTFCELINALQAHADAVIRNRADVYAIAVVGIDFSQDGRRGNRR